MNNFFEKNFLNEKTTNALLLCKDFVEKNDMKKLSLGRHTIDGDDIFVNVMEYQTQNQQNRIWEAHKDYIDLHIVITGGEEIHINDIANMSQGEYQKDCDFIPLEGTAKIIYKMVEGDTCLCMPFEGHKTGVILENSLLIKKAVFKIKIN